MKNRVIGSSLLVASFLLVGARLASAQNNLTVGTSYDFVYHEPFVTSAVGVHVDVAVPVGSVRGGALSGVGEIGYNHFEFASVSSFMVGGRWTVPYNSGSKLAPAVQVLVGAWHCCGENDFAVQPGFLIDYEYSDAIKIRGQVDLRHIFFSPFDDENAPRLSVGLVWELNK